MKTAIILGATGLTGRILLKILLGHPRYTGIKLFSRNAVGVADPKIEEYLGDILNLEDFKDKFTADEVFCCIGTTKSKTPNKDFYRKIDYGIPKSAAWLAKKNEIPTFIVISALGANPKSPMFYNRIKGEMEDVVLQAQIPKTHILRPSLIGGKRKEKRMGEWFFKQLMKVANPLLVGPLEKYRSLRPETIAKCMVWLANNAYDKIRIESDEIKRISKLL